MSGAARFRKLRLPKGAFSLRAYDRWRSHPMLRNTSSIRAMWPGMGIGTVAFAVYVVGDNVRGALFPAADDHGHGHGHGSDHGHSAAGSH